MDQHRIDALARRLAAASPTRRGLFKGLAGAAGLGLLARQPSRAALGSDQPPWLDFAYAVVRPSDWVDDATGGVVLFPGISYVGAAAGRASGALSDAQIAALPANALGQGFRQSIGVPAAGGPAVAGRQRTVTTWWQALAPSFGSIGDTVFAEFVAAYLAGTTDLGGNAGIGDVSAFHRWGGQTRDGTPFSTVTGTAFQGYLFASVRIDDFTGDEPRLSLAEGYLELVMGRGREMTEPGYQNLGTQTPLLPSTGDPADHYHYAGYNAYDGAPIRLHTDDDVTYALKQERLAEIERGYEVTQSQRLNTQITGGGSPFMFFVADHKRFPNGRAAETHYQNLSTYLAEDGPRYGFTTVPRADIPNLEVPLLANWWGYFRRSEQGTLPGVQLALTSGEHVAQFTALGAVLAADPSQVTAEYGAVLDEVARTAAMSWYQATIQPDTPEGEALRADLEAKAQAALDLQEQCLSGSLELCVDESPPVAPGEAGETTEPPARLDLAWAVAQPTDLSDLFGPDRSTFVMWPFVTMSGAEEAEALVESLSGIGAGNAGDLDPDDDEDDLWKVLFGPTGMPPSPVSLSRIVWAGESATVTTGLVETGGDGVATTIFDDIGSDFVRREAAALAAAQIEAALEEAPNEVVFDDGNVLLWRSTTRRRDGTTTSSQIGLVQSGSLVGLVQVERAGQPVVADPPWLWDPAAVGEDGVVREAPLLERVAERMHEVQQADYAGLGTTFPAYQGSADPQSSSSLLIPSVLSGYPYGTTNYTVVDGWTIRFIDQTDDAYDLQTRWNQNVTTAYRVTDYASAGSDAGEGDPEIIITRSARQYVNPESSYEWFIDLEERVDETVSVVSGLEAVTDPETLSFFTEAMWFRYVRSDDQGQRAGVQLYLLDGATILGFDVFSSLTIGLNDGFAEPFVRVLYQTAEAAAIDYHLHNGRPIGLSDLDLLNRRDEHVAALERYHGGTGRPDPGLYVEEVDGGEDGGSTAAGCPPGWTYDVDGPLGSGCYRCSYPCLEGTVYDARVHLCTRNGTPVNCTPKHQEVAAG